MGRDLPFQDFEEQSIVYLCILFAYSDGCRSISSIGAGRVEEEV